MHHGMLTVYKEKGYTSSDAVARLRGILRMRKIGHTGTLDPEAEGVLPMCLGNATRICELIADREKEYRAVMRLGVRTDTQDMTGEILEEAEEAEVAEKLGGPGAAPERIREAASRFVGELDQIPPMYSAVKINGKRLYDMARKGITVERKPRRITIYELEIEEISLPRVTMRIRCSKGTYIRTLCDDLGTALGTGAAMESLLRTRVGQFDLEEARTLDELERLAKTAPEALLPLIRPVDSFFADLEAAFCRDEAVRLLRNGNALTADELEFAAPEEDPGAGWRRAEKGQGPDGPSSSSLPGTDPGDRVIRVYDRRGLFYGLYKRGRGQKRYTAYKMFLPETK